MTVNLTDNAIQDIATFYANVRKKYPNTWTDDDVDNSIDKTIDAITTAALQYVSERQPLLTQLKQDGITEPTPSSDKKWYFTAQIEDDVIIVDNAIYYSNMSNRAYRRGTSDPDASLADDDRTQQKYVGNGRSFENSSIISRIVMETINDYIKRIST
ncbi:MAG: hypothetical protein IKP41_00075 [Bacteroidaceae bacterium]|nr:hypothetical protein [Bacteroidaceae bacterium]